MHVNPVKSVLSPFDLNRPFFSPVKVSFKNSPTRQIVTFWVVGNPQRDFFLSSVTLLYIYFVSLTARHISYVLRMVIQY